MRAGLRAVVSCWLWKLSGLERHASFEDIAAHFGHDFLLLRSDHASIVLPIAIIAGLEVV